MEGNLLPNRPSFIAPTAKPSLPRSKFTPSTLPLPPPPPSTPPSFPIDSLLQQLLHLSSSPKPTNFQSLSISSNPQTQIHPLEKSHISISLPQFHEEDSVEFLSAKGNEILSFLVNSHISELSSFLESVELGEVDLIGVLKGLELSGNWEKAVLLFEWVARSSMNGKAKLDDQMIECIIRILIRESQHSITSKLFDTIHIEEYALDTQNIMIVIAEKV